MKYIQNTGAACSGFSSRFVVLFITAAFMFSCESSIPKKTSKPNVIIILADDLGYADLGVYNKYSLVPTPNIDKLASQGIRFTDVYCPIAVCSPTRYALMTGTYPWRSWNKHGVMRNYERSMIDSSQLTLPQMFQKSGYITVGFGKWHLGAKFPTLDGKKPKGFGTFYAADNGANIDLSGEVSDGAVDHGFDHWLGFSCASECFVLKDKKIIGALEHDFYTVEQTPNKESIDMIPMDEYLPYITDASLRFLQDASNKKDKPFFLYYAPYVPHVPLSVSKSFLGSTQAGPYGDYVHELYFYVGELLKSLDSLQLTDNTIVLFASDNGSAFRTSYNGMDASNAANKLPGHFKDNTGKYMAPKDLSTLGEHSPNGILRGVKSTAWEGGVRTPLIARWPGHFPAGKETDEMFALTDVMPTLASIIEFKLDNGVTPDGKNLFSALRGEKENKRTSVVLQSGNNVFGLRQKNWKFIELPQKDGESYYELYNLSQDPSETKNLAEEKPEILKKMKTDLDEILRGNSTTL